jgi:UDPglucose 6-dehydrogenase
MKISVVGLWHLGTVTAACLAGAGHEVIGIDFDADRAAQLSAGVPPLFEPGLEPLVKTGLASGALRFSADPEAVSGTDLVWITYDTPVDEDDHADVDYVIERVARLFPHLSTGALVIVSAQLPVGTTQALERRFAGEAAGRTVRFAYSPENLRLGKAIDVFTKPDRVVVGLRSQEDRHRVMQLLEPFTDRIEWMSVESAEMTKHALNGFLAVSVTYINEIAALCEHVGADASEVARGLKSERRIGPMAYLSPGGPFAGGTLARDVTSLAALGRRAGIETHLVSAIQSSNDQHRQWAQRRLETLLGTLSDKTIGVWGLTYKPGTSTLRRSNAIELCEWLAQRGAVVRAHDPTVTGRSPSLPAGIGVAASPLDAIESASALVVATPWPEYRDIAAADVVSRMARPLVIDAARFTDGTLGADPAIEFISVGRQRA